MEKLDPRLHVFRSDLADFRLKDKVDAENYVQGVLAHVVAPVAAVLKTPDHQSERQTECLYGEEILVFERKHGFSWVQSQKDGYVGFIASDKLKTGQVIADHQVIVPRTFQYLQADLRGPIVEPLSMGSKVKVVKVVETRGTPYCELDNGHFIVACHLATIDHVVTDYVNIAESLVHTPYLWGGVSGFGIDCSGLVQLSMAMAGKSVLRDTDMQQSSIGLEISTDNGLKRGDLVFWKGHVAMMTDAKNIIHANGASMDVRIEPLFDAVERIAKLYAYPTCYRRPI